MISNKKLTRIVGWLVFAIAVIVYAMTAERTGSLWDCGEFVLGAQKLQVVHPPGAPLFLMVGRMFTWVAELVSSNPEDIAFSINLMSGVCTAFTAMFVSWITMIFGRLSLVGRQIEALDRYSAYAIAGAGLVAGLSTAFCSSIWFSAVEGEVYAMSTMFTALTVWAAAYWYQLPDEPQSDRWLVFVAFSAGLSIGVHLLSLLTFPAVALLFYFKKYKESSLKGALIAMGIGVLAIAIVQKFIIVGLPTLWKNFEVLCVNSFGLPFHSGLVAAFLVVAALAYFLLKYAHKHGKYYLQIGVVSMIMIAIGFSTIGTVVIRANADTPVNMNKPSDALRLLPYINREQYGERPLLYGPHYGAKAVGYEIEDRMGRAGDHYEVTDQRVIPEYRSQDKMLFPRVSHSDDLRKKLYGQFSGDKSGKPSFAFNLKFFFQYQINWMYNRYFMWNFVGRQNGEQGYYPWDVSKGNWASGIDFIDELRLHNMDKLPDTMKRHKATNNYYFLPLIFGLLGMFFHYKKRKKDFYSLLVLFLITGIGIIIYSNQPPNEPRERDYVLVGSFFTFCIWIGMGVLALFELLKEKTQLKGMTPALVATLLVMTAPLIMAFENWDDHSRREHKGARDYASNFLHSCDPNAIIFTYGDNDTYPLWYAQEVEGIRTDVRVVNLSLIAVDWYIDKLRNKVNNSAPIKMQLTEDAIRGKKRNQVFFINQEDPQSDQAIDVYSELSYIGNSQNYINDQTVSRSRRLFIPVNKQKALASGWASPADTAQIVSKINIGIPRHSRWLQKDQLAVIDIIANNIYDRPIYFATTSRIEKLLGLNDYFQLEGLSLKLIPIKTPSDQSLGIYGCGRVASDKVYERAMNDFRWGNFDKEETFVNPSYGAAIQSMRIMFMRAAEDLVEKGEVQKAVDLTDKFFESFPHRNFAYTPFVTPLIEIYVSTGEKERAKKHIRILAEELRQYLEFYDSVGEDVVRSSFEGEYTLDVRGANELLGLLDHLDDPAFKQEITNKLGKYDIRQMRN